MNGETFPKTAGSRPALGSGSPAWADTRGVPVRCQTIAHAAAMVQPETCLVIRNPPVAVTGSGLAVTGRAEACARHVPRVEEELRQQNARIRQDVNRTSYRARNDSYER